MCRIYVRPPKPEKPPQKKNWDAIPRFPRKATAKSRLTVCPLSSQLPAWNETPGPPVWFPRCVPHFCQRCDDARCFQTGAQQLANVTRLATALKFQSYLPMSHNINSDILW